MKSAGPPWRLLVHASADGAWNMAVDETLLESYLLEPAPPAPTLRVYAWRPPAVSLGRFQDAAGAYDAAFLRDHGIDLVRRPTGGGAVLHEFERTYSVVGRLRTGSFPGSVLETYRRIASALCAAMERVGLPASAESSGRAVTRGRARGACFATPSAHEISTGGRKLVGSAQLRRRGAFLQHGSILLHSEPERLARALGLAEPPPGYTDLTRALGRDPDPKALDLALVHAFETVFSVRIARSELTASERRRADDLRSRKYASGSWTHSGIDATLRA